MQTKNTEDIIKMQTFLIEIKFVVLLNKTNHHMSSNSQPSATAKSLPHMMGIGVQNQQGYHLLVISTKNEVVHPTTVS